MNTERFNLTLLLCSYCICAFIYADTYLMPRKYEGEKIVKKSYFSQSGRTWKNKTYEVECSKQSFDVTAIAYNYLSAEDSILIGKSILTNSKQNIFVIKNNESYKFNIGFINARMGLIFMPVLILVLTINLILNRSLSVSKDRKHLPYFWLIGSLLLFAFHLGIEYYFK